MDNEEKFHNTVTAEVLAAFKIHESAENSIKNKTNNPLVLLVEDDLIILKVHKIFLEKIGLTVDIASTGEQAWTFYLNQRYPLLILDGGLPDMTGFELGRRIRDYEKAIGKPATPLLLLSGFPYEEVKRGCELAGVNEFAIKPIRPEDLQAMVKRWLPTQ